MEVFMLLKFSLALIFVVAVMYLLPFALKRMGVIDKSLINNTSGRLKILEHLPLDSRRRLILVQRDDCAHLLLLGHNGETLVESNIPCTTDQRKNNV